MLITIILVVKKYFHNIQKNIRYNDFEKGKDLNTSS